MQDCWTPPRARQLEKEHVPGSSVVWDRREPSKTISLWPDSAAFAFERDPRHSCWMGPAATMRQAKSASAGCSRGSQVLQQPPRLFSRRRACVAMQAATEQAVQQQQACSPTQFLRPHLLKLAPYTPIEPFEVLSARYGRSPQDIVKLDANENPYGPPPEVRQALANMPFPHIYPDPETRRLRQALAEWNDTPIEHLLVSNIC